MSRKLFEKSHLIDLTAHLKALQQKEANSPMMSIQQEIIKLWTEINKMETLRMIQRISETKHWFFEKINRIDKTLFKLSKRQRKNI